MIAERQLLKVIIETISDPPDDPFGSPCRKPPTQKAKGSLSEGKADKSRGHDGNEKALLGVAEDIVYEKTNQIIGRCLADCGQAQAQYGYRVDEPEPL